MRHNRIKLKWIMMFAIVLLVAGAFEQREAYAAALSGSVSSATATQGQEVTVTFTLNADAAIGVIAYSVSYDSTVLQYVSGGSNESAAGLVTFYNADGLGAGHTYTIKFNAIKAGSTELKINEINAPITEDGDDFTTSYASGTVTVTAPAAASSNNNLSSLSASAVKADGTTANLTLSPAFSKDVIEYRANLDSGFTKLVLSAAVEDGKATVGTWGVNLKAGVNTTGITVTAEDGTQKTYYIYTTVKEAPTTEAPTTEPETDPPVDETRYVTVSDKKYLVTDVTESTALPEGFEITNMVWNDKEIVGASDLSKTLSLIYVLDQETGEYKFFIYQESDRSYQSFLTYNLTQRTYIMLMVEEEFYYDSEAAINSSNLEMVSLQIAGGYVDAYKLKNTENIYIVRAMNWNNEINYYYYNMDDGSMLPYFTNGSTVDSGEIVEANQTINDQHQEFEKRITKRNVLIFIMGAFIVIQMATLGFVIYTLVRKNKGSREDEEADEDITGEETAAEEIGSEETENEETENEETENEETENEDISQDKISDEEESYEKVVTEETVTAEQAATAEKAVTEEKAEIEPQAEDVSDKKPESNEISEELAIDTDDIQEEQPEMTGETEQPGGEESPMKEEEIDKAIDELLGKLLK